MANSFIQIDFDQVESQIKELDQCINELKSIQKNQLQPSINSISRAWKGNNAKAYLKKASKLEKQIQSHINDLEKSKNILANMLKRQIQLERTLKNLVKR